MNDKESPIHSMNVTLGSRKTAPQDESVPLKPWVMLICSDLGFTSRQPERITAATFNELFQNNTVVISGTVEAGLPSDIAPFHIEYPIDDIKDLSPFGMSEKLPLLKQLKQASALLDSISRNRITALDGFRQISEFTLPQSIVRQLGTIKKVAGTASQKQATPTSSNVDSILSMMDIDSLADIAPASGQPSDFVAAFTNDSAPEHSSAAIISCKASIDGLVAKLCAAVSSQPFFTAATSSWNAFKAILKTAGRNRDLHIFLHSAPFDAAERHFGDALALCGSTSGIPDLVVWDYPTATDTASIEQLAYIATFADGYKTEVILSLDRTDSLYKGITAGEPLRPLIDTSEFIPLRRLQTTEASRTLVLCAPEGQQVKSGGETGLSVSGGWLLALQWVTSFIENSAPFHLQNSSIMVLDLFTLPKISTDTVRDSVQCGITVLRPNGITDPRVLLRIDNSPYAAMLFNMAVNRAARLAAFWITEQATSVSAEAAAPLLKSYLSRELSPSGLITAPDDIAVSVVNGSSLMVAFDATTSVAGYPVRFDFTFGFRE